LDRSKGMEKILLVDDERNILEAFQRQLRKHYQCEVAEGGAAGMELIADRGPFAVVVSDYRMPGMDGTQFLANVKVRSPESIRMMLSGQADLPAIVEAVNQGEIFRFLTKPCPPETFHNALEAGLSQYRLIRAEKELLEQTLTGCLQALADVLSFVNPEAFGRASRLKRYVLKIAEQMGVSEVWQLEVASSLSQIGCVILPDEILQKINAGKALSSHELQAFQQHPVTGADLIRNIPRMQEVAEIIEYQHKHFDGSGTPHNARKEENIPLGARLLKVADDFDTLQLRNLPRHEIFEDLEVRHGWYDPAVLLALKTAFAPSDQVRVEKVSLSELRLHMVLAEAIVDTKGNILVAKGQELTDWMVTKLKDMSSSREIKEPIRVFVTESSNIKI
jgi:response regulator RpfG family c-di-GMP phosphodiesterase